MIPCQQQEQQKMCFTQLTTRTWSGPFSLEDLITSLFFNDHYTGTLLVVNSFPFNKILFTIVYLLSRQNNMI